MRRQYWKILPGQYGILSQYALLLKVMWPGIDQSALSIYIWHIIKDIIYQYSTILNLMHKVSDVLEKHFLKQQWLYPLLPTKPDSYSASQTSKNRIQKLQTRAARLITGSGTSKSRKLMFNKLKWLSLQQKQDFHKCILVYKCRLCLASQYLCDMFIANKSNHSYNTRNATQLRATITRIAYYYHSFTVSDLNL